jgi:hypothetical protein
VDMTKIIFVPHDGYMMSDTALSYALDIAKGMYESKVDQSYAPVAGYFGCLVGVLLSEKE